LENTVAVPYTQHTGRDALRSDGQKLSETPNCTCQLEFGTQYSIEPT